MTVNPGPWNRDLWALGLMSGTSMDGIDAALLRSDGEAWVETGLCASYPYDQAFRAELRSLLGILDAQDHRVQATARALTLHHAKAVERLIAASGIARAEVALIGFHGHTLAHAPERGITRQIGDGALLARQSGFDVISDFRGNDVAQGGQGAPLAPLFHRALAARLALPLVVLNIGGVANLTWIGAQETELLAFDSGPGNALIDDWVRRTTGAAMDSEGALAASGHIDETALRHLMGNPYFDRAPPKSLDRESFDVDCLAALSPSDGAATLVAFTAASVARAAGHLPGTPRRWLVTGGGRHNPTIMGQLAARLDAPVDAVEAVGWDGDALEAQAFAYLAVRACRGLSLTLPGTTGAPRPLTGGQLHRASRTA